MDAVDRAILNMIQESFPADSRPYRTIGSKTGLSEGAAFQRIEQLKHREMIRRLGGIFDSAKLGYVSTLCAARAPEDKIPALAELMGGITEITHSYLRRHHYNLWFTIIACSRQRLEQILNEIKAVLGSEETYSLPAQRVFKVKVCLNFPGGEQTGESRAASIPFTAAAPDRETGEAPFSGLSVSEEEKALIRLLQGNLPSTPTPFAELAKALNSTEEEVLAQVDSFRRRGILRRLAAVLYHQKAGFTSNIMGVWRVPEVLVPETGRRMAASPQVSHCYQRPCLPELPYNLYTMIHGHSDQECREMMAALAEETGIRDYALLFSQTELKKSSMRYFLEEREGGTKSIIYENAMEDKDVKGKGTPVYLKTVRNKETNKIEKLVEMSGDEAWEKINSTDDRIIQMVRTPWDKN
ncbi:transcriptional regulator, AsnC family [Syntrophobotulus glycolicus DSM 8271]|uniref:siroheme decarboxylase n=1 Tax=Syntrophobotulus glycolicus (strain DSM 8271 / FlGlyR) TaxID=645991 RepID=F0SWE6_SYNGF|nr:AsnC family transcriptional regulator [Syntrophobotulus glycolicus]ADY55712.1 transcriptional regulator, AsnC family [Syntrophobotulus glycolicus DSM 8271]